MKIKDLPERIGGKLTSHNGKDALILPYFTGEILITEEYVSEINGKELNQWEQVFIYNHMAQGGNSLPKGNWKGLVEFPNTISKQKSMKSHVEEPLIERFKGKVSELEETALNIGGEDRKDNYPTCSAAFYFKPMPKVPLMLIFWDESEEFDADAKIQFDETVTEHLDIESMMFLSERLRQLLCE